MIDHILKIATGTIQYVKGIDNIVELAIFIVSLGVCSLVAIAAGGFIIVLLDAIHEEIVG